MSERRTVLRGIAVGLALATAGALAAPVAYAVSYSDKSVTGYSSTGQSRNGNWAIVQDNGTFSQVNTSMRLYNADNHAVYTKLTTQTRVGTNYSWSDFATGETNRVHASKGKWGSWENRQRRTKVHDKHSYARGKITICIDVPFRSDPCSVATYTGSNRY